MKYKVLLSIISLCLLSFVGFSQPPNKDTINISAVIRTDSSQITLSKVYNDVKGAVESLSSSLKVGSEHIYAVLVKQQIVKGVIGLILLLLAVILWIALLMFLSYVQNNENMDWGDEWPVILIILLGISAIATTIGFFATLQDSLTAFFNPEYGALKEILDKIQK